MTLKPAEEDEIKMNNRLIGYVLKTVGGALSAVLVYIIVYTATTIRTVELNQNTFMSELRSIREGLSDLQHQGRDDHDRLTRLEQRVDIHIHEEDLKRKP